MVAGGRDRGGTGATVARAGRTCPTPFALSRAAVGRVSSDSSPGFKGMPVGNSADAPLRLAIPSCRDRLCMVAAGTRRVIAGAKHGLDRRAGRGSAQRAQRPDLDGDDPARASVAATRFFAVAGGDPGATGRRGQGAARCCLGRLGAAGQPFVHLGAFPRHESANRHPAPGGVAAADHAGLFAHLPEQSVGAARSG